MKRKKKSPAASAMSFCNRIDQKEKKKMKKMKTRLQRSIEEATHLREGRGEGGGWFDEIRESRSPLGRNGHGKGNGMKN